MGDSAIPYCTKSWNVVTGCTPCSPGCANCWAKQIHTLRHKAILSGKNLPAQYRMPFSTVQMLYDRLSEPLRWRKPQRVFVASTGDLFHQEVPFERIAAIFGVMAQCQQHLFLLLTKRPERMAEWIRWAEAHSPDDWPRRNVLLGATACTQAEVDKAAPILVKLAAQGWRTWLSLEPLLEGVHFSQTAFNRIGAVLPEWVVAGCEAGPKRRECQPEWMLDVARQCSAAGVAFFCKQVDLGGKVSKDITEWPSELQRQERPHAR